MKSLGADSARHEHRTKSEAIEEMVAKASKESKAGRDVIPKRLSEIVREIHGV